MIENILQIWDLGGQERFDFLKDTYFKGAAAVALVFDLSNPETFENLNNFLVETRKVAGPIPILLIGNKNDLEEELGEIIPKDDISDWMRVHQITDFIKTSAKTGDNINSAFDKLTILSLIDLNQHPRPGEFRKDGIFRFKIIFVGSAGVGKTSIIRRFSENIFQDEYKLTIGLDFITKKVAIDEETLPEEALIDIQKLLSEREIQLRGELTAEEEAKEETKEELAGILEESRRIEEEIEKGERIEQEIEKVEGKAARIKDEVMSYFEREKKEVSKPPVEEKRIEEEKEVVEPKTPPSPVVVPPPEPIAEEKKVEEEKIVTESKPPPAPGAPSVPKMIAKEKEIEEEKAEAEPIPPPPPVAAPAPKPITEEKEVGEEKEEVEPIPPPPPMKAYAPKPISYQAPMPSTKKPKTPSKKAKVKRQKQKKMAKPVTTMMAPMTEEKLLRRKTTVFYKRQMNPQTLNKLSVILSTEKIYEELKKKIVEAERKASGKTLEIKELSPYVEVRPVFPGCICVPSIISLDARKEADTANFQITPLAVGHIRDARVLLYYENQLIDIIKTPTKVVKQTGAKISGSMAIILPIFGPLFDNEIGKYLPNILPFYNTIGGIQGLFLILSGIAAIIGAIFYWLKRPKEAEPVESIPNFPEIEDLLKKEVNKI